MSDQIEQTYCPSCGPIDSWDEDCCCHSCGCYVCEAQVVAAIRLSALREIKEWVLTKQGFAAQSGDWEWARNLGVVLAKLEEMEQR